jgi:hypothetical protein
MVLPFSNSPLKLVNHHWVCNIYFLLLMSVYSLTALWGNTPLGFGPFYCIFFKWSTIIQFRMAGEYIGKIYSEVVHFIERK